MSDSPVEGLRNFLCEKEPVFEEILKSMVEINSFSFNVQGVNQLGQLTSEVFAPLGFKTERVKDSKDCYGEHLFLHGPGEGPQICLVSHLDTVFTEEEEKQNDFRWNPEGNRIYGPGTMDIKGGTVLIFLVLSALKEHRPEVFHSIRWMVALNSAEEVLSPDFSQLCFERLDEGALACLVFEGAALDDEEICLIKSRKGRAQFRIEVEGRSAHAGASHSFGVNAIRQLADVVETLESMTDYDRDLTVNVGRVNGGTMPNRVPQSAFAEGELRAFSAEVLDEAVRKIRSMDGMSTRTSPEDEFPARVSVQCDYEAKPWGEAEGTTQLMDLAETAAARMGLKVRGESRGGVSDGNAFVDRIPTIDGLGPGGGFAHCSERSPDGTKVPEFVRRDWVLPKALHACLFIEEIWKNRP